MTLNSVISSDTAVFTCTFQLSVLLSLSNLEVLCGLGHAFFSIAYNLLPTCIRKICPDGVFFYDSAS